MSKTLQVAALALAFSSAASQAASFTTLTLPTLNADIRTWTDGATYDPLFPGSHNYNGVPFALAEDASSKNIVYYSGVSPAPGALDIPVGVYGVTATYSLINSAYGGYGTNVGSMEFFGSGGAYYKVDLVEGTNVRDHYDGYYNNVIDNVTAIPAFNVGSGHARLDEQIYTLPAEFASQTLTKITFTGVNQGSGGIPFIAAATVSAVPEPAAWALMLAGLGIVALRRGRV